MKLPTRQTGLFFNAAFFCRKDVYKRQALARALVNDPPLIIADEPTGNIDPELSYEIVELLRGINQCGTTIVMVTHNMQQATRVSDKTAFFHLGEVIEFNDTDQLFSMPSDKRTEDYITGRFG